MGAKAIIDRLSQLSLSDTITALGIVAGFVIYFLQRQRKALGFRVCSISGVATYSEPAATSREHNVVLEFTNIGNTPLVEQDFLSPIVVEFPHGAKVLDSSPYATAFSDDLPVRVSHAGSEGLVTPALLNPSECVRVQFRIRDLGHLRVRARIVGVTRIGNLAIAQVLRMHASIVSAIWLGTIAYRLRAGEPMPGREALVLMIPYAAVALGQVMQVVRAQRTLSFRPGK